MLEVNYKNKKYKVSCNMLNYIIRDSSISKEEVVVTEVDLAQTDYMRKHWPFFRDRRIETYSPITKRFIDED